MASDVAIVAPTTLLSQRPSVPAIELRAMMLRRPLLTWSKFGLMLVAMATLAVLACVTRNPWIDWPCYVALGYLWMSLVTFMHDATHDSLLPRKWQNLAFGIVSMLPLPITFIAFREDHLRHHRFNRSVRDPDAFTMGSRRVIDFIVFYLYLLVGGALTVLQFALIYPVQYFGRRAWSIHLFEIALKAAAWSSLWMWAASNGMTDRILAVWLWPMLFFSVFNSLRFIAEHYETPWGQGNLLGTRTVTSNRVHSFFWNNINWHIGHHVYPKVPWHNLVRLHERLAPQIAAMGGVVDPGYGRVCWRALVRGPESEMRLSRFLAADRDAASVPQRKGPHVHAAPGYDG